MRKGRGGIAIRRGQHPAIGQDLRLPVGQDEQEGNSWDGWGREERQASPERRGVGSPVAQLHCSPVLGIRKPVLKCHGAANEASISNAAKMLLNMAEKKAMYDNSHLNR